jgi:hypothetical protein
MVNECWWLRQYQNRPQKRPQKVIPLPGSLQYVTLEVAKLMSLRFSVFKSFIVEFVSKMNLDPSLRMPKCHNVDIEDKSIRQLQNYLTAKTFTSRELTECYLKRIELVNPYTRLASMAAQQFCRD